MAAITMIKIIKEINIAIYGDTGICNCSHCRRDRFNECENRLLLQIAPSLSLMPLKVDRQGNYNNYNIDLSFLNTSDRQKKILSLLKGIELQNKVFKKEYLGSTAIKTCINCGLLHIIDHECTTIHENKEHFLCSLCVEDYERCKHCDTLKRYINFATAHKNYTRSPEEYFEICSQCYKNHYSRCHICGYIQVHDQFIVIPLLNGSAMTVCSVCCENSKVVCSNCGKNSYTFLEEQYSNIISGRHYCVVCLELRTPVHNHEYKPFIQHFHKGSKEGKVSNSALYFGFELEIERHTSVLGRTSMAEIIKDKFSTDYIYIVHDGSIDEGIEVVSHPFTWNEYKENIDRWNSLLLFIRTKEWKANRPKAGFHVHMTKAAFTTFHLFKFLKFFYREHNKNFICVIAQRQPTSFSVFSSYDKNNVIANAKDKANRTSDHYSAVNLNNKDTIEVRIFRGTLEPLYFHKNIEFLHAIFKYSRDHSPKQMEYVSFINYVQQYRKLYPCLWEFLTNDVGIKTEERKV